MNDKVQREVFSLNLKKYMNMRGLRQVDIADKMNRTPSIVSDWCKGVKYPRPEAMQELSELLGVKISDLTDDKDGESITAMDDDEREIVALFRKLGRPNKHKLMAYLYGLSDMEQGTKT